MDADKQQDFGSDPIAVRETDHYIDEYVGSFAERWDELIDWESRGKGEERFFIDALKDRGAKKILDVATGTGYHSVRLMQEGFDVTSVDGSPAMLAKAFENGKKSGLILRTVSSDWRWLSRDIHEEFDAIICLGNSFTHLFREWDRRRSLAEFYSRLKHDGVLIMDQRNYDAMLDNQELDVTKLKHGCSANFVGYSDNKHTYYYCGKKVSAFPEYVDNGLCRFRYEFPGGEAFYLNMYPLRKQYVKNLMREVGFQTVDTYGDFKETYTDEEPDFFVHIAEKEYRE